MYVILGKYLVSSIKAEHASEQTMTNTSMYSIECIPERYSWFMFAMVILKNIIPENDQSVFIEVIKNCKLMSYIAVQGCSPLLPSKYNIKDNFTDRILS